eukprot:9169740-Lingulodinium_polyedra.AAC.1
MFTIETSAKGHGPGIVGVRVFRNRTDVSQRPQARYFGFACFRNQNFQPMAAGLELLDHNYAGDRREFQPR